MNEVSQAEWNEAAKEELRLVHYDIALMNYNEAWYAFVYCPENEDARRRDTLDKMRSIWFAT